MADFAFPPPEPANMEAHTATAATDPAPWGWITAIVTACVALFRELRNWKSPKRNEDRDRRAALARIQKLEDSVQRIEASVTGLRIDFDGHRSDTNRGLDELVAEVRAIRRHRAESI